MDSCELDPGGEESEASPWYNTPSGRRKASVRRRTASSRHTSERAGREVSCLSLGRKCTKKLKNHSPTAPTSKPLAPPYFLHRPCLSRPTESLPASALLPSEGFSSPSLQASSSSPSEALLLPPKRYYCCHPRGATGASDEELLLPRLRHYSLPSKPAPSPAKEAQ